MKILVLSGSNVGNKTRIATESVYEYIKKNYSEDNTFNYINLQDMAMVFADGRNYLDYEGDTAKVANTIMDSDVIIFGTPIFQASIPATLKNVFDLLPEKALEFKTVSMIATAGSKRHYLIPQQQLIPILTYLRANVAPKYVFLTDTDFGLKGIESDDVQFRIQTLVEDTMILAKTYKDIWAEQEEEYGF